ncbi:MAG: type II toxin-antitoxin system Phd/YefM family antitoxin [Chloroflexi bacterium]|nr:MAG: type II toxin-antitoxin system Phd/YefM family antitoxin [Chloroflexota bacterium]
MKIASVAEVKAKFSGYLRMSREGPVVVTKNGKPVAVLLAVEDEEELERLLLAYSPKLRRILEIAEREIREGRGKTHQEFWAEVEEEETRAETG